MTVALTAGWNAVGFEAASLTSLEANSAVAGMATYDDGYQFGSLTMTGVNAGAGTRRGFWLFATSATSLSYSGTDASSVSLDLKSGWNLVAFPASDNIPGSQLTCQRNGQPAPLTSYVLGTFYEIGTGSTTLVDVSAGGVCKPGKAYWVYALEAVSLSYGSTGPTPSPTSIYANGNMGAVSPGGAPPTFTLTSAHVITEMWTYHYQFSGTLGTLSLQDASGTTYGPWAASGLTSSSQPKWYWTVKPNLTLPAGTYTVYDSDPASWSQNSGSGGKGHVQVYGYPVGTTPSPTPTPGASPSPAGGGLFTLRTVTTSIQVGELSGNEPGTTQDGGTVFWNCNYTPATLTTSSIFTGRQWWVDNQGVNKTDWTVRLTYAAPPSQIRLGDVWPISATSTIQANSGQFAYVWQAFVQAVDDRGIFPGLNSVTIDNTRPAGTTVTLVADRQLALTGAFDLMVRAGVGPCVVQHLYRYTP